MECISSHHQHRQLIVFSIIISLPKVCNIWLFPQVVVCVLAKLLSIAFFGLGYFFSRKSSILDVPEDKDDIDGGGGHQLQAASNHGFQKEEEEERWKQNYVAHPDYAQEER